LNPNPWDDIFAENGRIFNQPHPDLPMIVQKLNQLGARKILDLGCGTGRHTVYLSQHGFQVYSLDGAPHALLRSKAWLSENNLKAYLLRHEMTEPIPFPAGSFDGLISTQVIHHARLATVQAIIAEIHRLLKPGGLVYVTVAAPKEGKFKSIEVEPRTYLPLGGPEKGLLHHLFTEPELRLSFADFQILDVHLDDTNHHCLTAIK